MVKKNTQKTKTKTGTTKHGQSSSNENISSCSQSGQRPQVSNIRQKVGKKVKPSPPTQNQKKTKEVKPPAPVTKKEQPKPSTENAKKRSTRNRVSAVPLPIPSQTTTTSNPKSKEDATQMEQDPANQKAKKKSKRKTVSHEQNVKTYFRNIGLSKKEPKVFEPGQDKMPAKLKELKLNKEERTHARTRKHIKDNLKTACEDEFEDGPNFDNNGQLFDGNRNPFWTVVLFDQNEAEKEGIEVEGRITSEHVIKYLEGTLAPIKPNNKKLLFDVTKSVDEMRSIDDAFFNDDAIMYNTLQNIINHSERAVQRCTGSEEGNRRNRYGSKSKSKSKSSDSIKKTLSVEETVHPTTILFFLDKVEKVVYERENAFESIQKYIKQKENLRQWENISVFL